MSVAIESFDLKTFETQLKGEFNIEIPPHLFTNDYLILPIDVLNRVQNFVSNYYNYICNLPFDLNKIYGEGLPKNSSILMSYDFHLNQNSLKLIEINTNASGAGLIHKLNNFLNIDETKYYGSTFSDELKRCINEELNSVPNSLRETNNIVITDEKVREQRMYLEFLIYQKLFENMGWKSEVRDISNLEWNDVKNEILDQEQVSYNFVYNRLTDFYLKNSKDLLKAYLSNKVCVSPNPKEYHRFANKERLIEVSLDSNINSVIKEYLLKTVELNDQNRDFLRKEKKKFIFKPKQSYAGKSVYRGKSITTQTLERLFSEKGIAQEYFEPGRVLREANKNEFKFDLRFYVYKDKVQLTAARLYQGQVTNFRSPGSGLTTVSFE